MSVYYNENDPKAAAWLRELITQGEIPKGVVDDRSIEDVTPNDVRAFTQCHFFAGIGGWSLALKLAGWPDDRPVWTGSCPCQPFSAAGKGAGFADERHLWPSWLWLIRQHRPRVVFGEQVASAGEWLDLVSTDLEGEGYAFGAAVLGAHSVGAPHIRQRFYWVAHTNGRDAGAEWQQRGGEHRLQPQGGSAKCMANAEIDRRYEQHRTWYGAIDPRGPLHAIEPTDGCRYVILGDAESHRREQRRTESDRRGTVSPWDDADWLPCQDGKARPVEPGTFPLAHGVSGRVGLLRGYGNAIVPQAAAAFVEAYQLAGFRGSYLDTDSFQDLI